MTSPLSTRNEIIPRWNEAQYEGDELGESMITTTHTPTPYKAMPLPRRSNFEPRGSRFHLVNADSVIEQVAVLAECKPDDAAFIVTACNAHAELVAALRECVIAINRGGGPQLGASGKDRGIVDRARAVLAKVAP